MTIDRRRFLGVTAAAAGAGFVAERGAAGYAREDQSPVPESIRNLKPMTAGIAPIGDEERKGRIQKAQRLMAEHGLAGMFLESGTSLFYFTGVRWGQSERMFGAVIPARGDLAYICPKFEEDRARELIRFGNDVRTWEEDEDPARNVAQIFKDRGIGTGRVGIEERVRFFLFDGIRKAAPAHRAT